MRAALLTLSLCALLHAAGSASPLADAAEQRDLARVRALLLRKLSPAVAQADGSTALHWAALHDDLPLARALLAAHAPVDAPTRINALTPLFMAARNGSAPMLDLLLRAGAAVDLPNDNGTTPLMMAAAAGNPAAVQLLLAHRANPNARELAHGQTPLMFAAALGRADAIRVLLAGRADPSLTSFAQKISDAAPRLPPDQMPKQVVTPPALLGAAWMGGQTALLYAAREGKSDAIRALLDGGAAIDQASDKEEITPLLIATVNGHFDAAMLLLSRDADPNLGSNDGLSPLYAAIDVRWAPFAWLPQPITTGETTSHLDLLRALLDRGASPDVRLGRRIWMRSFGLREWVDPTGATPFWRAAQALDVPAMQLLLERGADPRIPNASGDTALMVAAGVGWAPNNTTTAPAADARMSALRLCLAQGLDVTAADSTGYTALHGAAFRGDNEMVSFLVSRGASVTARTQLGDSPADMANGPIPHSIPHPETVALLEKLGSPNSHNCRSDQCLVAPVTEAELPLH